VRELVDRLGARGRNGVGVLRTILDDRSPGDRAPESPKETQLLRLLLANGLPRPVAQYEVRHHGRFVARVDFAYPDERIAIEYDSYEFHTGVVARDRDAVRRRALLSVDWRVVPVTNADLKSGCVSVATTIAMELRRR
jgi:very-short-patch-repair endonuclease